MTGLIDRPLFVTPHAVGQFQQRVAEWPAGAVIDWLLQHLQQLPDEVDFDEGTLLYVVPFGARRITVVIGPGENEWPAVITVIGDTQRVDRLMSWRGKRWGSRDSKRLRILRHWGFRKHECATIMGKPVIEIEKRWERNGALGI